MKHQEIQMMEKKVNHTAHAPTRTEPKDDSRRRQLAAESETDYRAFTESVKRVSQHELDRALHGA